MFARFVLPYLLLDLLHIDLLSQCANTGLPGFHFSEAFAKLVNSLCTSLLHHTPVARSLRECLERLVDCIDLLRRADIFTALLMCLRPPCKGHAKDAKEQGQCTSTEGITAWMMGRVLGEGAIQENKFTCKWENLYAWLPGLDWLRLARAAARSGLHSHALLFADIAFYHHRFTSISSFHFLPFSLVFLFLVLS